MTIVDSNSRSVLVAFAALLFVALSSGAAWAQEPPKTLDQPVAQAPEGPSKGSTMQFKVNATAPTEKLPAWPFLYGAYACIWSVIFGYVLLLWLKQRKLDGRIASLDRRLDELDKTLEQVHTAEARGES